MPTPFPGVTWVQQHPSPWMRDHLRRAFNMLDEHELTTRIQEFLRFIYLQSTKQGGFIPVTEEIDLIWHEYILQTREYLALCLSLPSKSFVHHQTSTLDEYAASRERHVVVQDMLDWIPRYYHAFGAFTEKTAPYWTIVQFLQNELSLSLAQINQFASNNTA
jgi:hypothetical protein